MIYIITLNICAMCSLTLVESCSMLFERNFVIYNRTNEPYKISRKATSLYASYAMRCESYYSVAAHPRQ